MWSIKEKNVPMWMMSLGLVFFVAAAAMDKFVKIDDRIRGLKYTDTGVVLRTATEHQEYFGVFTALVNGGSGFIDNVYERKLFVDCREGFGIVNSHNQTIDDSCIQECHVKKASVGLAVTFLLLSLVWLHDPETFEAVVSVKARTMGMIFIFSAIIFQIVLLYYVAKAMDTRKDSEIVDFGAVFVEGYPMEYGVCSYLVKNVTEGANLLYLAGADAPEYGPSFILTIISVILTGLGWIAGSTGFRSVKSVYTPGGTDWS